MAKALDRIAKIPIAVRIGVFAALCLAVIILNWWLVWSPKRVEIQRQDTELNQLTTELNRLIVAAANIPALQRKVQELSEELKKAQRRLPSDSDITQVLRDLAQLAEKSGVRITTFQPDKETKQNLYASINIRLSLEGSYHEIATFFDRVGKLSRIINIGEIKFQRPQEENGVVKLGADCMATTFRFTGSGG